MIKSRRARRMERNHQRARTPSINLVAFMDILTILVFFLLVNSSTTQRIPSKKELTLPVSVSKVAPEDTLVIQITRSAILLQGVNVGTIEEVSKSKDATIPRLKSELVAMAPRNSPANDGGDKGFKVTVMGDENISYELVRKILTTCQEANYTKIAFAAVQSTKSKTL
jgi:biopolymer transport protein ExbD